MCVKLFSGEFSWPILICLLVHLPMNFLEGCSKEQLLEIAEYYKIVIKDKRFGRESIKLILKTELIGKGFLKSKMDESVAGVSNLQTTLSFDQQKELLLLQMEHEKLKRSEGSKLELEKARLEVEALKLKLAKEGR